MTTKATTKGPKHADSPPADPPPLTLREAADRLGVKLTPRDLAGFDGAIRRGRKVLVPVDQMLFLLDHLTDFSGCEGYGEQLQ